MAGLFIDVKVDEAVAGDPELVARLEEVCPVDIFDGSGGSLEIVEANLDECVLCDLCLDVGPMGAVRVIKLYEQE